MSSTVPRHGVADLAYAAILDKITTGHLAAGSRLREELLADELQVSRTPIREALRRLRAEGYVEHSPNKGARVAANPLEDLDELFDLRLLLEGFSAGLAALRITEEQLMELVRIEDEFEKVIKIGSGDTRVDASRLNLEFHNVISGAAGNARLQAFITSLVSVSLGRATFETYSEEQLQRSASQHRQLIEAFERRDRPLSEMAMRVHISGARNSLKDELIEHRSRGEIDEQR